MDSRKRIKDFTDRLKGKSPKRCGIREFARRVGVSHTRINQILDGDRITYDMAMAMSKVMKCSWKSLFEERTPRVTSK